MEPDNMSIPVVDIAEVLSRSERLDSCDAVEELHSAFTTVGFVFIRNHGIDKKLVGIGNQIITSRSSTAYCHQISAPYRSTGHLRLRPNSLLTVSWIRRSVQGWGVTTMDMSVWRGRSKMNDEHSCF